MRKYSVVILFVFFGGAFFLFQIVTPVGSSEDLVMIHIEKGEGNREIGAHLKDAGFIRSAFAFRLYAFLTGVSQTLKAGDYELSVSMSLANIVQKIASGDVAKQTLTIIEGWDRKDIAQYLQEQGVAKAQELAGLSYENFEGYLFPDTYIVRKGAWLEEIIKLMRENFDKKVSQEMRGRDIIIMASLIEKEVRTPQDKRMVSGILWKRLKIGMPLQVDATITYLTGKTKVSNGDAKIDSPYNTYRYKGLPVGPIANPGLESIRAALEPQESPYLYYLSTSEGETIFSKTLQEHNTAKAKHLR